MAEVHINKHGHTELYNDAGNPITSLGSVKSLERFVYDKHGNDIAYVDDTRKRK